MPETLLPYNANHLDRAGGKRADDAYIAQVRARPGSYTLLLWRDRCLVGPDGPCSTSARERADVCDTEVFLGLDGDVGVFAADLSALDEPEALAVGGATATVDVRRLFPGTGAHRAALLAYARGLLFWHRHQQFCGACGGPTESRNSGHARACRSCGTLLFPRIEPAVIALVQAPGPQARCLLGRHRGAGPNAWSTLAGFVELGESLEDAVRREVAEEAGVRVGEVAYQASQTWPFPAGLMIGFHAVALSDAIAVDHDELIEARWFTPAEVLALNENHPGRTDSIEQHLVERWLTSTT